MDDGAMTILQIHFEKESAKKICRKFNLITKSDIMKLTDANIDNSDLDSKDKMKLKMCVEWLKNPPFVPSHAPADYAGSKYTHKLQSQLLEMRACLDEI
jgi:hypothetical protein